MPTSSDRRRNEGGRNSNRSSRPYSDSQRRNRPHNSSGRPSSGHPSGRSGRPASNRPRNQRQGSRNQNIRMNGRGRSYDTHGNYRTIRGSDTGLNVRHRSIGFSGREGFWERMRRSGNIGLVLIIAAIIILIVLVLIITSCVRAAANNQASEQTSEEQAIEDNGGVATGLSADLTSQLQAALERNDQLSQIAHDADQYQDTRLIELALNEPDAVSFVAGALTADKTSEAYSGSVTAGQPPLLYDFDTSWGYVDYGDGILGITGSGPTTLSMAYMGLTGNTDQSPADIASAATEADAVTGDSQMSGDFVVSELESLGITATSYEVSTDNISSNATDGALMVVEFKADTITNQAHWALIVGKNDDGSYILYDPTSAINSTRSWAVGTLATNIDELYVLSYTASEEDSSTSTDSSSGTSSSSSSSSNTSASSTSSSSTSSN